MRIGLCGLLLLQLACADGPALTSPPEVEVRLERASTDDGPRLRVIVSNQGSQPVYVSSCAGIWVEREGPEGWVMAAGPSCVPVPMPPVEIPAGLSHQRTFSMVTAAAVRGAANVAHAAGSNAHRVTSEPMDTRP